MSKGVFHSTLANILYFRNKCDFNLHALHEIFSVFPTFAAGSTNVVIFSYENCKCC